jgi:siroheme synthase
MAVRTAPARPRSRRGDLLAADAASIAAGISLVGRGVADSVVLVGFRFAERLLPWAMGAAQQAGVDLTLAREAAGPVAIAIRRNV